MGETDNLIPDYDIGFGISFGGDQPTAGTVTAQASTSGACPGCAQAKLIGGLSLPLILVGLAVLVLAFRR